MTSSANLLIEECTLTDSLAGQALTSTSPWSLRCGLVIPTIGKRCSHWDLHCGADAEAVLAGRRRASRWAPVPWPAQRCRAGRWRSILGLTAVASSGRCCRKGEGNERGAAVVSARTLGAVPRRPSTWSSWALVQQVSPPQSPRTTRAPRWSCWRRWSADWRAVTPVSGQVWFGPTDVELAKVYLRDQSCDMPVDEEVAHAWAVRAVGTPSG